MLRTTLTLSKAKLLLYRNFKHIEYNLITMATLCAHSQKPGLAFFFLSTFHTYYFQSAEENIDS